MIEAFHMGGWGMYPTLVFGLAMLVASARYAISPEKRFVPLQISLGIMTLVSGGLGFVTGMIKCFTAMEGVPPEQRWIWMLGVGEALHNVALALMLLTIGSLVATVGAYRFAQSLGPAAKPAAS